MEKVRFNWLGFMILVLFLASIACSAAARAAASPTSTPASPTSTATSTTLPTTSPVPTFTPDLAATRQVQEDQANLHKYLDSGYIDSTRGTLYELTAHTQEMAQKNYLGYDFSAFEGSVRDFAAWADLQWSSAAPVNYPEFSGCGFGFRMNDNGDAYTAIVTNDSVLVTWCFQASNACGRVGKTSGKGTVTLANPGEAHFEFIVNRGQAVALVNGDFIARYTLFSDRLTEPGSFTYSIISGTNKDYGTRCTVTNGKIWVPDE